MPIPTPTPVTLRARITAMIAVPFLRISIPRPRAGDLLTSRPSRRWTLRRKPCAPGVVVVEEEPLNPAVVARVVENSPELPTPSSPSFTDTDTDTAAAILHVITKPASPTGRVLGIHLWEAGLESMGVNVGDRIVISKNLGDGWCVGYNETTCASGLFPVHCVRVEVLDEEEEGSDMEDGDSEACSSEGTLVAPATPVTAAAVMENVTDGHHSAFALKAGEVGSGWCYVGGLWIRN
ncbi:hypothetical protein HK101_001959 [Irineochytrium annulatum]|nr:hypothetical protein HK101_001959 [Irineochytrium annulatum]